MMILSMKLFLTHFLNACASVTSINSTDMYFFESDNVRQADHPSGRLSPEPDLPSCSFLNEFNQMSLLQ